MDDFSDKSIARRKKTWKEEEVFFQFLLVHYRVKSST